MANSILQGVVSPNVGQGLLNAFAQGQDIYNSNQAAQLNRQAAQQRMSENDYQTALRKIQVANNLAKKALSMPPEQRQQLLIDSSGALQSLGFTPDDLANTPLDDQGLQNLIAQTDSALQASGGGTRVQSSQILDDGTTVQVMNDGSVRVTDSAGGILSGKAATDAIRAAQEYGTRLQGSRAAERTRETLSERQVYEPELKRSIKEQEQGVIARTEPQIKASEKTATQSAEQRTIYKTQALAAAENMPTIKRAIQLQEEINSGGGANALRKMANYLGVSSADEGELNSLFGQNILGQLKSTFGGNPTEGERLALEQAQASFSQTGKINIRLLNNAMKLAELRIRRGKQAAKTDNDEDTLQFIDDAMSIDFNDEPQGGSGAGGMTPPIAPTSQGGWSMKPLGK